jgi:hypothetical protein
MFSLRGFFTLSTGEPTSRKIFLDVVIVRVVLRSLATVQDDIGNLKETSLNESIAAAPLLVLDCSSLAQAIVTLPVGVLPTSVPESLST